MLFVFFSIYLYIISFFHNIITAFHINTYFINSSIQNNTNSIQQATLRGSPSLGCSVLNHQLLLTTPEGQHHVAVQQSCRYSNKADVRYIIFYYFFLLKYSTTSNNSFIPSTYIISSNIILSSIKTLLTSLCSYSKVYCNMLSHFSFI